MVGTLKKYLWNILISLDQFGNTLLGGDPDETISRRAARNADLKGWRALAFFLEKIDPGHMERSLYGDEEDRKDASWTFPGENR